MTRVWNSGDKKSFVKHKRNVPYETEKKKSGLLTNTVSWKAKIIIFNSNEIENLKHPHRVERPRKKFNAARGILQNKDQNKTLGNLNFFLFFFLFHCLWSLVFCSFQTEVFTMGTQSFRVR